MELGVEVNNWCRSPQLGTEVTDVPKLLVPNIDCPLKSIIWLIFINKTRPTLKTMQKFLKHHQISIRFGLLEKYSEFKLNMEHYFDAKITIK